MTMRLLLDTHALLWWWNDAPQLPAAARSVMADPANAVFVSAASAWEIATKVRKNQLPELAGCIGSFVDDVLRDGFSHLDVTARHGVHGGSLPGPHKDPFDRLIAAQALLEDMTVVTCDRQIAAFGCETLW
ncbi:type II toxin-antitoxin system VapC family toxin [Sphingomonas sp.]|jgi:PIN domain nuclease of toxin-antitoxin system|uniref:type II toxin-antitoxin system VapC family toxin n=1 Tax=Sphingomonas sp. TaxID=28214 RepID=UPI002E0EF839|nr:type II toxin-antitoxin system VapC family toxin [Sphingomonas sp.]